MEWVVGIVWNSHIFHIPLNMGSVFPRVFDAMEKASATDYDNFIVLSYDPSAWTGEHFFAASKDVAGLEMVRLSGGYLTKVFEGPFKHASKWMKEMEIFVEEKGKQLNKMYFFYTTCPKCAKVYGKNYVVGVAQINT